MKNYFLKKFLIITFGDYWKLIIFMCLIDFDTVLVIYGVDVINSILVKVIWLLILKDRVYGYLKGY